MSEDFSFLVYVRPEDEAEAFVRLVKRLAQRSDWMEGRVKILGQQERVFSLSELTTLLNRYLPIRDSMPTIDIEVAFKSRYRSRQKIVLLLQWYLTPKSSSDMKYSYGPFQISFVGRGLRSFNQWKEKRPFNCVVLPELHGQEVDDFIALFFDICGVFYRSETAICHAGANVYGGWMLSERLPLLYHRDLKEFAYDLLRTSIYMRSGILPLALMNYRADLRQFDLNKPDVDRWYLIPSILEANKYYMLHTSFTNPYVSGAYRYQKRLTPELVERVLELPTERIRTLILELAQESDDLLAYDFGEGGMVVAFDLAADLWLQSREHYTSLYKIYDCLLDEVTS